jgi:acetylornithine deacetylase/succinyl-diaminopimelate desuccinylase-like protein
MNLHFERVKNWLIQIDYLPALLDYIKIPSISKDKENVYKAAQAAKKILEDLEFKVTLHETSGNHVVYAENINNTEKPSILIYGHYDVQPVGDLNLWNTDPFSPLVKNGKIWGRGSADNKGQHYAHFLALKYLKEEEPEIFNKLNVKIILDGDEELGSFSLPEFIQKNTSLLDSEFVYVSDGPSLVYDSPTIVGSVRGILGLQISIEHNKEDLHSGNFGGVARSASRDIIALIDSMVDINGRVKIKEFYDMVNEPTKEEISALNNLEHIYNNIIKSKGISPANIHRESHRFQNQLYPTMNINGIKSGGVDNDRRTIIPSIAKVSIDCRLVPNMKSDIIKRIIEDHVKNWAKEQNIEDAVHIEFEHSMEPIETAINTQFVDLVKKAAIMGFAKEPIIVPRLGGSLPIYLFPKYLKKPVVLVPYALPDENNHAPNENLDIQYFENGVAMTAALLKLRYNSD